MTEPVRPASWRPVPTRSLSKLTVAERPPAAYLAMLITRSARRSAASATPPAMTTANYLGTTVDNPTARDLGLPASTTWTPIVLTVAKDTTKPVVTLTVPSKANAGASWATVRGTVKDTGTGPKAVYVQLVDAKGKAYSSWSGSKWVKASSRTAALKAAKKLMKL